MRNLIKKILKESEDDWGWLDGTDVSDTERFTDEWIDNVIKRFESNPNRYPTNFEDSVESHFYYVKFNDLFFKVLDSCPEYRNQKQKNISKDIKYVAKINYKYKTEIKNIYCWSDSDEPINALRINLYTQEGKNLFSYTNVTEDMVELYIKRDPYNI